MIPEPALFDQRHASAVPAPTLEPRTAPAPRPPAPRPTAPRRRRVAGHRVQRTIRHVDVWSVFKLSIFYYTCFTVLWLLLVAAGYFFLQRAGLFHAIQRFGKAMVLWDHVHIDLIYVEKWALLLALAFLIIGSLINALIAFLYNFAADVVGGVELTFIEKDVPLRSQPRWLQSQDAQSPLDQGSQE